jgi:hypothetical protein
MGAGHSGETDLMLKALKASEASILATATAAEAQKAFAEAYEALQKARLST